MLTVVNKSNALYIHEVHILIQAAAVCRQSSVDAYVAHSNEEEQEVSELACCCSLDQLGGSRSAPFQEVW